MFKLYSIEGAIDKPLKNILTISEKRHLFLQGENIEKGENSLLINTRRGDICIKYNNGIELTSDFSQDYVLLPLSKLSEAEEKINEFVTKANSVTARL